MGEGGLNCWRISRIGSRFLSKGLEMTYQQPAPPAYTPPPARKLSISSMLSLICGILGCVPFATGALAVLLGIIGMIRTSNPLKSGRWMAILGMVLGLMSLGVWTIFGGFIFAVVAGTQPVRTAAHDFIRDVAAGNDVAAKAETLGMADEDYATIAAQIKEMGAFKDTLFPATIVTNDTANLGGAATFDKGVLEVTADLKKDATGWKVQGMHLQKSSK